MNANREYYSGLAATTWDVWRDDTRNWPDRNLYLKLIERWGQPALVLGCGTGRLWLDYRELGMDVDGVDVAPDMLEICRSKAVSSGHDAGELDQRLRLQSVEALDLPRKYRSIIAPSSLLQILTEPGAVQTALRRIYDHLLPGGGVVGSFYVPWRAGEALQTDWSVRFEKPRPTDGALVRSTDREWYEPDAQAWHTEQKFEVTLDGKLIDSAFYRRSPEGLWYTPAQVGELLETIGFREVQMLDGFSEQPAADDAKLFCALAVKPRSAPS